MFTSTSRNPAKKGIGAPLPSHHQKLIVYTYIMFRHPKSLTISRVLMPEDLRTLRVVLDIIKHRGFRVGPSVRAWRDGRKVFDWCLANVADEVTLHPRPFDCTGLVPESQLPSAGAVQRDCLPALKQKPVRQQLWYVAPLRSSTVEG